MGTLYNIADDYINLFEAFDDADLDEDTMQAYFDTLEGIEGEFGTKAENIAVFIKSLKAEADAIEAEEKALKERKESKRKKLERLKQYLKNNMEACGLTKIDAPKAKISIRNNAESVQILNELEFIDWATKHNDNLLKYAMPEIKKAEIKKLLQSGTNIPYAKLTRGQSLIIK